MYISCDPGISNFGLAVIDDSHHFRVVTTVLVKNIRKFTDEEKALELIYGGRAVKVLAVIKAIEALLAEYPEVDLIVVEAPFYNALTPVAFSSLIEVISAVKYKVAIKEGLVFKAIEPLLVKKLFTNKGVAAKEVMRQFLITRKEDGSILLEAEVDTLSEHEIDAIAVGFSHYLIKNQPLPEGK